MIPFHNSPRKVAKFDSQLFDERTFYHKFTKDLKKAKREVIIESPYITSARMRLFHPIFNELLLNKVSIYVITRSPSEHDASLAAQSEAEIVNFEQIGVNTLLCIGSHHRKLTIIDKEVLWEGSLNILSQTRSREIMRRIESRKHATQMFNFLKFGRYI